MTPQATAPRSRLIVAFASIYLIWGSTYLAIKFAIETLPPFLMAGLRFLVAGALIHGWMRLRGAPRPSRLEWKGAAIVGGFLLLGGNGGVVWAQQTVPSGLAALIVATVPLWMVLAGWAAPGGTRPTGAVWLGVALGFAGIAVLIGPAGLSGAGAVDRTGAIVLVLASLSWAIGSIYARRAVLPASPLLTTGMQMIAGGAILAVAGTLSGEWARVDLAAVSMRSLLGLAYLILFGALLGYSAYVWLLRHTTPARVSTYAYVNPVVAVFLGWAFANEPVTLRTLVGAAVIVSGVALITTGGPGRFNGARRLLPRWGSSRRDRLERAA